MKKSKASEKEDKIRINAEMIQNVYLLSDRAMFLGWKLSTFRTFV